MTDSMIEENAPNAAAAARFVPVGNKIIETSNIQPPEPAKADKTDEKEANPLVDRVVALETAVAALTQVVHTLAGRAIGHGDSATHGRLHQWYVDMKARLGL